MSEPNENPESTIARSRTAVIIFVFLSLARIVYAICNTTSMYHLQTNELTTTALMMSGRLDSDQDNLGCAFYSHFPSLLPWVEMGCMKIWGGEIDLFLFIWAVMHQICFCMGEFYISRKISGSDLGGLLGFVLASASWITQNTIGYGFVYYTSLVPPGLVFQSVGVCILALASYGHLRMAFACVGLLANFHPVIGIILAGVLIVFDIISNHRAPRRILIDVGCMCLLAIPGVSNTYARTATTSATMIDWDIWWSFMEAYKSHHMFPWRKPGILACFTGQMILMSMCLWAQRRRKWLGKDQYIMICCVMFCAVCGTFISYLASEEIRQPRISSLMFSRASVFVVPFAVGLLAHWIVSKAREQRVDSLSIAIITLTILLFPLQHWEWKARIVMTAGAIILLTLDEAPVTLRTRSILMLTTGIVALLYQFDVLEILRSAIMVKAMYMIYVFTFCVAMYIYRRIKSHRMGTMESATLLICMVIGFAHHVAFWQRSVDWIKNSVSYPDYLEVTRWIRFNTPPNAHVLMPPIFCKAPETMRRVVLPDIGQIGVSMYNHTLFDLDVQALKTIYGINLRHTDDIARIKSLAGNVLMDSYSQMTDDRLSMIKSTYPKLGFVVVPKASMWLNLPVVHANAHYKIYSMDVDKPNSNRSSITFDLVCSLDISNPSKTLSVSTVDTTIVESNSAMICENLACRQTYMIESMSQDILPGESYMVDYEIIPQEGNVSIGILDVNKQQWITQQVIPSSSACRKLYFSSSSPQVKIIIFGSNDISKRTRFTIRQLNLFLVNDRLSY